MEDKWIRRWEKRWGGREGLRGEEGGKTATEM